MGRKKKSVREIKIWTLDAETRGLFGGVFRIGLYSEDRDGNPEYTVANSFEELYEVLCDSDFDNHVYVHNLDFDLSKIAPFIFTNDRVDFEHSMFINGSVATLTTDNFILHDSLKLLKGSLDKLSKDYELDGDAKMDLTDYIVEQGYGVYTPDGKLDIDESKGNYFNNVPANDKVLNEYLYLDCRSLYKLINITAELSLLSIADLVYCPTVASLCMAVYKNNFKEDYEQAIRTKYIGQWGEFLENFLREGYYGGRTEVFKPWLYNGFHYDVNSEYPYAMKTYKFPVGNPEYYTKKKASRMWKFWKHTGKGGGALHCKVFIPDMHIPPLPKHDISGKLIFPVGHLDGIWAFPEIAFAETMGCVIEEIVDIVYFPEMAYIFKGFIEHFEKIKTTSKGGKRTFAKDMSNNLYGKFGMRRKRTAFASMEKVKDLIAKKIDYIPHKHTKNMMNVQFVEFETFSRANYIQPQIAMYTTAYARLVLLKGLLAQQAIGEVGYCDTDSVACDNEMLADWIHDYEYGKFKLESIIYEGKFLQPKFYAERGLVQDKTGAWVEKDTLKFKGIPKKIMKNFTFEKYREWSDIITIGEETHLKIFDGLVARKKFLSMLKNSEDLDTAVVLRKRINLTLEQKRIMDYKNNCSTPLTRNDYGENMDDKVKIVLKEEYEKKLFGYYDDIDVIWKLIKQIGFIQHLNPGDNFYNLYQGISEKKRRKYFRNHGVNVFDWCLESGWTVTGLFEEMEDY